jgi:hypothetical protein
MSKTLNDIKDEISLQFGTIMSSLSITDINTVMAFILSNFANDFPEVNTRVYKLNTLTGYKIYLDTLNENFLEVKLMIPVKKLSVVSSLFLKNIYETTESFVTVDEIFSIQLTSQYINNMSSYYVPTKPMILTDSTGEYVSIQKDSMVIYTSNRVLDPNDIKEHIFSVLKPYTFYKFIEFIINSQYGKYMDINEKIFNLIYDNINSDMTNDELSKIREVSLSGLSVSFDNDLSDYSDSLKSLANNFNDPNFAKQMNIFKNE